MGSGDGRGPYHWAAQEPSRLVIASDANACALEDIAWKAGRKPARGGISNLLCIAEPLDVLSEELGAVADRITVILPWGSLLRAVAVPEIDALHHIARLCLPNATVEIVFSYEEWDAKEWTLPGSGILNEMHMATLPRQYALGGLEVIAAENISSQQLATYETTWANRLAFGRPRKIWRVRALRLDEGYP